MKKPRLISDVENIFADDWATETVSFEFYSGKREENHCFLEVTEWENDPEKTTVQFYPPKNVQEYWKMDLKQLMSLLTYAKEELKKTHAHDLDKDT